MRVVKAPIAQRFYSFRAPLQIEHWRTSWSKLIWQLNFYQRFSKVSSCPVRSIAVLGFPDVAYMRGIRYLFSDYHQKWPRTHVSLKSTPCGQGVWLVKITGGYCWPTP